MYQLAENSQLMELFQSLEELTLIADESFPIFIGKISPRTIHRKVFDAFLRKDTHVNL